MKKKLGNRYQSLYLKNILKKLLGNFFFNIRDRIRKLKSKFNFLKTNLNKKIEHQSIVQNESGLIINLTKDNFLTYHLRPKSSDNFNLESTCTLEDKFAIIVQGPIQEKFIFLKNIFNIYKKIFKNCLFIISTCDNENIYLINNLINENTHIIFNKEPENSQSNINHQVLSTYEGLELARKKGARYALKTRSDIRINKNNLETFLVSLINIFPVKKNKSIKSRIIVPSLNSFKYRLYSISDIVIFGETEDLLKYFKNETFKEGLQKFNLNEKNLLINETPVIAEIFLCSRFIYEIEGNVSWTLDNWWKCLKNYFCIIDNSSLDLFWYKYDWEYEYRYMRTYSDKFARALDFQDWLSLYDGQNNNWNLASSEHEKYNNFFQLKNIFKN